MDGLGRHVDHVARPHFLFRQRTVTLDFEEHAARIEINRFVFQVVVLKAQCMTGLYVQDLADVSLRFRPMELIPPWLLDARHSHRAPSSPQTFTNRDAAREP